MNFIFNEFYMEFKSRNDKATYFNPKFFFIVVTKSFSDFGAPFVATFLELLNLLFSLMLTNLAPCLHIGR